MEKPTNIQTIDIPMSKIETNRGQIPGVPKNPRFIRDEKYRKLVQSLTDDAWLIGLKPLIVYPRGEKYVIMGGNMRFRAMLELGFPEAPCKVIPADTPAERLRAAVIKDNASFGEWEIEDLMRDWDMNELSEWGIDIETAQLEEQEPEEAKDDNYNGDVPKSAKSHLGDMYKLGRHRLVCGDSCSATTMEALMGGDNG